MHHKCKTLAPRAWVKDRSLESIGADSNTNLAGHRGYFLNSCPGPPTEARAVLMSSRRLNYCPGLLQRRSGKRAKSRSKLTSSPPFSMASAASTASGTRSAIASPL